MNDLLEIVEAIEQGHAEVAVKLLDIADSMVTEGEELTARGRQLREIAEGLSRRTTTVEALATELERREEL